jgi:tetratricopeptide (TPR) repeat protein
MPRFWYLPILFLAIHIHSFACLNEYHTLKNGMTLYETDYPAEGVEYWKAKLDIDRLKKKSVQLYDAYTRSDSLEYLSDYAVTLTYLGQLEMAKMFYLKIESIQPDLYNTAANLGTVYELLGQNDSALFWIKKGIELYPDSHEGSEWIHVKILEHKIMYGDSANVSVLGLDFGNEDRPKNIHNYDLRQLIEDIIYQLKERTLFVKPPNQIVGSLYADAAAINFILHPEEEHQLWIKNYYLAAKTYEFTSAPFEKQYSTLNDLIKERARDKSEKKSYLIIFLVIGGVILVGIIFVVIKRKKAN